jgi:hypothetical protein
MPNIKRKCIGGGLNKTTGVFSVTRKGRLGNNDYDWQGLKK